MEEKYSVVAKSLGMRYDGINKVMCGQRDGFDIIVYFTEVRLRFVIVSVPTHLFDLSIHTAAARQAGGMLTAAERQELADKVKNLGFIKQEGYDIIVPNVGSTAGLLLDVEGFQKELAGKLDSLCSLLRDKGFRPCCSRCGQEREVSSIRCDAKYLHLCPSCVADIGDGLAVQAKPRWKNIMNIILGMAGMLLGVLLGIVAIARVLS